jgi:SnoaL-like domain
LPRGAGRPVLTPAELHFRSATRGRLEGQGERDRRRAGVARPHVRQLRQRRPHCVDGQRRGDVLGIGTDADEWWEGRSVIAKVVTTQVQEMSRAGVRLIAGQPHIVACGDVVWSVDRPVLHLGDGTETPLRVTAIAVSVGGSLHLTHFHYSVGSVNAEVFQQELTTR